MPWMNRVASQDRKSTRLNSSHDQISYAVFCLKKKISPFPSFAPPPRPPAYETGRRAATPSSRARSRVEGRGMRAGDELPPLEFPFFLTMPVAPAIPSLPPQDPLPD